MIGYLKGRVVDSGIGYVIVGGENVGYRVVISSNFKTQSPNLVELFIHTYVREDQISLYGFADKKSLKLFELLISVSGVGPKVGMAILGGAKAEKIESAISKADVSFFTAIPGIGKKGAQKIIIDLKNKIGSVVELDLADESGDEVVQALVGMGYEQMKVVEVLGEMSEKLGEGEKIKKAIKKLSSK